MFSKHHGIILLFQTAPESDLLSLCATCHVEILEGKDELGHATDVELDQLESLPEYYPTSRLACQIRIGDILEGAVVKLRGEDVV